MLDSNVYFRERMAAIGFTDPEMDEVSRRSYGSFGAFAFCSTHVPGAGDDQKFIDDVVNVIFPTATTQRDGTVPSTARPRVPRVPMGSSQRRSAGHRAQVA